MTFLLLRFRPVAVFILLPLIACSCSERAGNGGRGAGARGGAAPVLVGHAQHKRVPLVLDAIGTVEPIRSAAIRAQITGTLQKIDIREGQDVAAGDLLFEIDPRPFENALQSALADQQKIAVQLQNARAQLERYSTLNVGAMVSKDQFEQVRDAARALEAQAASIASTVATARLQLAYCTIRAPIAGRSGNLNVHEGDMIRANDVGPLVTVNQLSPIYVTFGLAQQHLPTVARYHAASTLNVDVTADGANDQHASGELTFIDNTVDPTTGTIKMKATLPNENRALWPGQFATIEMTLTTPDVLTIPSSAVQSDQTGQHVFVVTAKHVAELRPVVVERTFEDDAVVTSGLSVGDTIVTDGQLRILPGQPVQIMPDETLTNPEALQADVKPTPAHAPGKRTKEGT